MIVATAGHVDHGKTTLVRVLTGMDCDTLPQEKARGISIDLGFAHWDHSLGQSIGFVDVPGHERFIRNMLCGVCAIDHVLLVVAADDGVMPQTREHASILDLLGVSQATVAITKIDRCTPERVAQVTAEVSALLQATCMQGAVTIAVAALRGDGMDALRERLLAAQSQLAHEELADGQRPRYVIDRVFSKAGSGTVVTGTVIAGRIAVGDHLMVSPAGTPVRIRAMQQYGRPVDEGRRGQRCAINLAHIESSAIGRGDWLLAPQAHAPTDRMDVHLNVLATESAPLQHWTPVHLHIGSADVSARVAMRRGASIAPGASGTAQLRLARPVSAMHGDRLILRDQSSRRTLGGSIVLDPLAAKRRSSAERALTLEALALRDSAAVLAHLLNNSPRGLDLEWFQQVFNLTEPAVTAMLPADALVLAAPQRTAFSAQRLHDLRGRIMASLHAFHRDKPGVPGLEIGALAREVAPMLAPAAFALLLKHFASDRQMVVQGGLAHLPGSELNNSPRDMRVWQQLQPLLVQAGVQIPSARELAAASDLALPMVRDVLYRISASGQLVKITPERFGLRETLTALAADAHETARAQADGVFTAAQYRDRIGVGRGLAIEILECFDRLGLTRRVGNARRYTGSMPPVLPGPSHHKEAQEKT